MITVILKQLRIFYYTLGNNQCQPKEYTRKAFRIPPPVSNLDHRGPFILEKTSYNSTIIRT